jgi:gamma-glutamyltranspeptidase/glutathione hydrolase
MSIDSSFTTRPELAGTFGMVASTHWLASAAGMAMLERGGNAFDAAVATGLVLQVVEPHLNGPGGEVPVIGFDAARGGPFVLSGQGTAPAAATLAAFGALGIDLIPGNGLLPACVPAAFGTWMLLLRDHGSLPLRVVIEPAIGYAAAGYPVLPAISAGIASVAGLFREHWPSSAGIYLTGAGPSGVPVPGSRFANPALAATYQRLLAEAEAAGTGRDEQIEAARRAFYQGFVAEAIAGYLGSAEVMDVTGTPHRGLLGYDDLAGWRAAEEAPASFGYAGLTVCKTPPWGQGPVFLQQLSLLDGFGLADMRPGSAQFIHTVVECAKLAFADREAWYGDPRYGEVPLDDLLSPHYAAQRRELVSGHARADLVPGSPGGRTPRLPAYAFTRPGADSAALSGPERHPAELSAPERHPTAAPSLDPGTGEPLNRTAVTGDTCHLDAVDRFGNMVAATPSGGWLQSSPVIPGLGFCLGTRGQMFSLTDGLPNTLAPGKRPRTTLSPGLALRDGEPYLAFGTPGGDQQDQWTLPFFLNHVHFGLNLQQAIDAPAFHTRHFPSSFYPRESYPLAVDIEARVDPEVIAALRAKGHDVTVMPPWSLGRISAVARDRGFLYGAANPRGMQGYAVGR